MTVKKALTWRWKIDKIHKKITLRVSIGDVDDSPDQSRSDCPVAR